MTNAQRFWSKVDKPHPERNADCWLWTASAPRGYGTFRVGKKTYRAHRYAYALANGPVPRGHIVRQTCGHSLCVRPSHLVAAPRQGPPESTHAPANRPRGEAHPQAILCEADVRTIRASAARGVAQTTLAHTFGVTQPTISYIVRRKVWKHV